MDHKDTGNLLDHERLEVYQYALTFTEDAYRLSRKLPRGKGQLGDQLERASESIVLRIAEAVAADRESADRRRHFRAALGSTYECAAVLKLAGFRGVSTEQTREEVRNQVVRLAKMLGKLAGRKR